MTSSLHTAKSEAAKRVYSDCYVWSDVLNVFIRYFCNNILPWPSELEPHWPWAPSRPSALLEDCRNPQSHNLHVYIQKVRYLYHMHRLYVIVNETLGSEVWFALTFALVGSFVQNSFGGHNLSIPKNIKTQTMSNVTQHHIYI